MAAHISVGIKPDCISSQQTLHMFNIMKQRNFLTFQIHSLNTNELYLLLKKGECECYHVDFKENLGGNGGQSKVVFFSQTTTNQHILSISMHGSISYVHQRTNFWKIL